MPPQPIPTESQILSSYLLTPASLPTILPIEYFRNLFPAKMRSHPHVKSLYRDLQFGRSLDMDVVRDNIAGETQRGDRMKIEMWRALREGQQHGFKRKGRENTEIEDEVDAIREEKDMEIDTVLFGPSGSSSHSRSLKERGKGAPTGISSFHSLESLLTEMEKATDFLNAESEAAEQEAQVLISEIKETVGALSDLRYGTFTKAGGKSDIGEEVKRALARLDRKFRASWSKYNLYNLSHLKRTSYRIKNFFQQKWTAKSLLRQYHGEQVREGQWERMFARRLRGVVPIDPEYLAANDGTLESAGRGSGLKIPKESDPTEPSKIIPYMAMTFAPLERRLDSAVFRALFASSARQARQFVVHGGVKVNGKKMIYPGYLLNPGDMFQVDPERVMYATGKPKLPSSEDETEAVEEVALAEDVEKNTEEKAEHRDGGEAALAEDVKKDTEEDASEAEADEDPRVTLKALLKQAKGLISNAEERVPGKRKREVRSFQKAIQRTLSRSQSSTILTDNLEAQFQELKHLLKVPDELPEISANRSGNDAEEKTSENNADGERSFAGYVPSSTSSESTTVDLRTLTDSDVRALKRAMEMLQDNPIEPSKPYATPWEPRDYMSAFAFIPRYLEVNQNICAAVYLRHPVARPSLAEVPSPYSESTHGEAFAWYLRRR